MTPEQQYELKLRAITYTNGDIAQAKALYAWLTEAPEAPAADTPAPKAEKSKADKPKADKPKAPEQKAYEVGSGESIKTEQPALNYDTDVLPKIVATVSRLTTAGADPQSAKSAIVAMMKDRFGVSSAKDIPAEKWADLVAALDTVAVG